VALWKGDNRVRLAVVFSLVTVTVTDQLSSTFLKPLIERPRPCWNMEVHLLVGCGSGFSMPSSHAANLFGQAYFFRYVVPATGRYLIPLAIVVALSRVFVGVHYPADIIVGAALGTLAGAGIGRTYAYIFDRRKKKKNKEGIDDDGSENRDQPG